MSIKIIDTLESLGDFPVTDAGSIDCNGTRLDDVLNSKASTQSLENYVKTTDSRLYDSRPASDVYSWAKSTTKPSYAKSEVGLGNVDNTSDVNKPISQDTRQALNSKASVSSVNEINSLVSDISENQAVMDSRLDAIESGTTPEGSEIIGVRTGIDGTVYENAGTAVRAQINKVKLVSDNTQSMFSKSILISGNSSITDIMPGDSISITEVGTNKLNYSATAVNKQLVVDSQGSLQLSSNSGWGAIASGVILQSGHDYVFFTDNGTKVSIIRIWYMDSNGTWNKIEENNNKDFKVISIPEHTGDCAVDFWNNSYISGNAKLCVVDSMYYSGEYIPYENSIDVDGETYEINARTILPINVTTTKSYISVKSNTTIRVEAHNNKESVVLGSDIGLEKTISCALDKCPVQLNGVATLNDDVVVESSYFKLKGTENAVINGNGHYIFIKNPITSVGTGTLSGDILTLSQPSSVLKVGDTVSVGGSIRLIANVISIDGTTVKLSNSADYNIQDTTVSILPKSEIEISGLKLINCWIRLSNANGAEIKNNHFVKGASLTLNGTLVSATHNVFDNFADGITAWSLVNSFIDNNKFSSAKQGVRCVYINGISVSNNIIENLTNPLSSLAIELTSEDNYVAGAKTMACHSIIKGNIIHGANVGVRGSAIGGIHLNRGAHHNLIDGNECKHNSMGIYLENGASYNRIVNNICNNQGGWYGVGIELDWDCSYNIISGNQCNYNIGNVEADESAGIEIRSGFASDHADFHNIVTNNVCVGNGKSGIMLAGYGIICSNNETSDNGRSEFEERGVGGIYVRSDAGNVIVMGNIITDGYNNSGSLGANVIFEHNIIIETTA